MRFYLTFVLGLLLGLLQINSYAQSACSGEQYRAFDFWIGQWEVYNPKDQLIGYSRIQIDQDSCLIKESWASVNGKITGSSMNFYDGSKNLWRQVWVDNQGGILDLFGAFINNEMILSTLPSTETALQRIRWSKTSEGWVRQVWEQSEDQGSTFKIVFEGIYKPRK